MSTHPNRRGLAAAVSGALVAGAVVGSAGIAAPANADEIPVPHDFTSDCKVTAGGLNLGTHAIDFDLATKAEVPLVPGTTVKKQDVSITLTMPKSLQRAVGAIGITHAKGGSPNSAVDIRMPVAAALGGHQTKRIALRDLKAAKAPVPPMGTPWKITSEGFVPRIHIPGFAGKGKDNPSTAALRLAPKFRINSTLFSNTGKRYKSVMKCTVRKADRLISRAPILGAYKADTVRVHARTTARKSTKVQLVFFSPGEDANNSWTKPKHGKLTPGANGLFTYKPNRNFVGLDSFTYSVDDSTGQSTSKVTIRVRKAPTKLKVNAPKKIRFGKRATVRVRVNTRGASHGKIRLMKGKRVLYTTQAPDGVAKLYSPRKALKVGKHKLRVAYSGNKTARKANARFTLRVRKASTNLKVHAPKKIRFGKRANVRVRVNTRGAAKGNVRLIRGKRVLDRAKVRAGKARLHIKAKALKPGKHRIRAVYAGSKTAQWANAKFTLRVLKRR